MKIITEPKKSSVVSNLLCRAKEKKFIFRRWKLYNFLDYEQLTCYLHLISVFSRSGSYVKQPARGKKTVRPYDSKRQYFHINLS